MFKCYSQAVEFNQRNKLEVQEAFLLFQLDYCFSFDTESCPKFQDRSAADLAKRFSEQLKFGARKHHESAYIKSV